MIKTYMPNALMRAAADVAKAHPIEIADQDMSDTKLRMLLDQIQSCPVEQLPTLAWSLLSRQVFSLCRYLPHNRYNKPIDKIISVISVRMEAKYFGELFDQWQKYPGSRHILRLLSQFDSEENHAEALLVPVGQLRQWFQGENTFSEVNKYILSWGGQKGTYRERMIQAGLRDNTPLYSACFVEYLTSCSMGQLVLEGDEAVSAAVKKGNNDAAELILLNLLVCGERDRDSLKRFPECFAQMKRLWLAPYGGRFPKNQEKAQRVFQWMCNYVEMLNGFMLDADPRRKNFWEQ